MNIWQINFKRIRANALLGVIFCIYLCALLLIASTLTLSPYEQKFMASAQQIFTLSGWLNAQLVGFVGANFARGASMSLIILAAAGVYRLVYLEFINFSFKHTAAALAAGVFALCPGVLASALLLDGSALFLAYVMALALLLNRRGFALLFCAGIFVQSAVIWLYLGALLHFHLRREQRRFLLALLLLIASVVHYELDFSGRPRGYLFDYIALSAAVMTPSLLMYYFYFVYNFLRSLLKSPRASEFLSCISAAVLIISLLLSLRQKPDAAMFLPFLPLAVPPLCVHFVRAYYLHVRANRARYKAGLYLIILVLLACDIFVLYASLDHAEFLAPHQQN